MAKPKTFTLNIYAIPQWQPCTTLADAILNGTCWNKSRLSPGGPVASCRGGK